MFSMYEIFTIWKDLIRIDCIDYIALYVNGKNPLEKVTLLLAES